MSNIVKLLVDERDELDRQSVELTAEIGSLERTINQRRDRLQDVINERVAAQTAINALGGEPKGRLRRR